MCKQPSVQVNVVPTHSGNADQGILKHACNTSTWETEAVQGQKRKANAIAEWTKVLFAKPNSWEFGS